MSIQPRGDVEPGRVEHYRDAALYDHEYRRRRDDISFYCRIARRLLSGPGSILELACGSGRITSALLRDGHSVVGVDYSQPMLARAASRIARMGLAHRRRAALVRGDMRHFAFARRFHLIIMAFNSFEHLYEDADLADCLSRVRDHLAPGGHFVFDVQNPSLEWLCRDPDQRWCENHFRHPRTGEPFIYTTNHRYDPIRQINFVNLYYKNLATGTETIVPLSQRKFFPAELCTTVRHHRLTISERYGDFDDHLLSDGCENQVLVCQPACQTS
jgi:SAM-dependent methyltransferase